MKSDFFINKLIKTKNRELILIFSFSNGYINFVSKKQKLFIKTILDFFFYNLPFSYTFFFMPRIYKIESKIFGIRRYDKRKNLYLPFCKKLFTSSKITDRQKKIIYKNLGCISMIKTRLVFSLLGKFDRLSVTGYARKSWLGRGKGTIFFKIGKSFINKLIIPKNVKIKLIKKRLIIVFSANKRVLNFFTNKIFNLRPADDYIGEGIRLKSKKMLMKSKLIKK